MRPRTSPQPHPRPGAAEPAAPTETADRSATSAANVAPSSSASTSSSTPRRRCLRIETVLYLFTIRGWSAREIATHLGLCPAVVQRLLRRARRQRSPGGDDARARETEVRT